MILVLFDDDHESKGSSGLRTEIWEEEASKGGGSCNCASESERSERRTQGNGTPTTEASFLSLGSASAALAQISPSISTASLFYMLRDSLTLDFVFVLLVLADRGGTGGPLFTAWTFLLCQGTPVSGVQIHSRIHTPTQHTAGSMPSPVRHDAKTAHTHW